MAFYFVYTYASATIPTKQRPYAFWGLPALAFALHGWQRGMFARESLQHFTTAEKDALYSIMNREDLNWQRNKTMLTAISQV
jgi:hypothetical protein